MTALRLPRAVLARVGWMTYYQGVSDSDRISRGGEWDDKQEVCNFLVEKGRLRGYTPANNGTINLGRIERGASDEDLDDVLVVFHAVDPVAGGQRVVGWYEHARVHRHMQRLTSKAAARRGGPSCYNFEADAKDAVLVPRRARSHCIPRGKGATGYSAITYLPAGATWVQGALNYIRSYKGINLLDDPTAQIEDDAAEAAAVSATARGQGCAPNAAERQAIEQHAVRRARRHFSSRGYRVEDIGRPYDLRCTHPEKATLYVEVKGTQGAGDEVFLTRNEVSHALARAPHTALFIVHSIELTGREATRRPSGGTTRLIMPWHPRDASLTPLVFRHVVEVG